MTREIEAAVAVAFCRFACAEPVPGDGTRAGGVLLAISGGRDSMVLLHAAARASRAAIAGVATFDHRTGAHARAAAAHVRDTAAALGLRTVAGRATGAGRNEAEWRDARWGFLREAAAEVGAAAIATAHTRDDQLETVVMRAFRGAGARGLSGFAAATSPGGAVVIRPLVLVTRAEVAVYASDVGVRSLADPSNTDRRHLRVRVRTDLLPAIGRVRADAAARLSAASADAARWRAASDAWSERAASSPRVSVAALAGCSAAALAVFWPAFAARAGVRLDRRAIARLLAYTPRAVARVQDGSVQPVKLPLAGGNVRLRYSADAGTARGWQFIIQGTSAPGGPEIGVASTDAPDYA